MKERCKVTCSSGKMSSVVSPANATGGSTALAASCCRACSLDFRHLSRQHLTVLSSIRPWSCASPTQARRVATAAGSSVVSFEHVTSCGI